MLERRTTLERRIADLDVELNRLIDMVAKGLGNADRLRVQYGARSKEYDEAKLELSKKPEPINPVTLHPAAIKAYRDDLNSLAEAVSDRLASGYPKIGQIMRELIESVTVRPEKATGGIDITIQGKLRALLSQPVIVPQGVV